MDKISKLAEIEGFDSVEEMLEEVATDSCNPGICTNEGCDYTVEVEPDCDSGWCEDCEENSVKSALVLLGLI
jgi:hypothetical protein